MCIMYVCATLRNVHLIQVLTVMDGPGPNLALSREGQAFCEFLNSEPKASYYIPLFFYRLDRF